LNADFIAGFVEKGAKAGTSAAQLMRDCEVIVTCLPSPAACDAVVTEMLPEVREGKIWM
jgi:3-hydroxyisobutyrate dehydrogenase